MNLPPTLTDLYVGGNKFTKLNGAFPNTLKLLYVHDLPLAASLADSTIPPSVVMLYVKSWALKCSIQRVGSWRCPLLTVADVRSGLSLSF